MWRKFVFWAFLFNGFTLVVAKLLGETGLGGSNLFYLLIFYSTAFLWSLILCVKNRIIPDRKDIFIGLAAGVSSFLGSLFMMIALNKAPGTIVFPIAVGGNLITVALLAVLVFKEKLGIKGILGIIFGVIGLIMLNI